jgi:hypothetical protein
MPRWKKGESGNPRGRPKGSGEIGKLRAAIGRALPDILAALIEKARTAETCKPPGCCWSGHCPPSKPVELPEAVPLEGATLTDQGRAVLRLLAAGELGPGQAAALLAAIAQLGRVVEIDELTRRVEALERGQTREETEL